MGGRGTTRRYRGGANSSCTQTPGAQERTRLLPTRPLEEISLRWVRTEPLCSFVVGVVLMFLHAGLNQQFVNMYPGCYL